MEKTTRARWAARLLFSLAAVGVVCFIWGNSLAPAEASGNLSGQVTAVVNQQLQRISPRLWVTEHLVRKSAHFTEHCALGALLLASLAAWCGRVRPYLGWALFAGLFVPVADEFLQQFSPGRAASVADVALDFLGVLCGLALAAVLRALGRLFVKRWKERSSCRP